MQFWFGLLVIHYPSEPTAAMIVQFTLKSRQQLQLWLQRANNSLKTVATTVATTFVTTTTNQPHGRNQQTAVLQKTLANST